MKENKIYALNIRVPENLITRIDAASGQLSAVTTLGGYDGPTWTRCSTIRYLLQRALEELDLPEEAEKAPQAKKGKRAK